MSKEKVDQVLEKILKSKIWEFIFVIIYPIIILLITESINDIYIVDKMMKIEAIMNLNKYYLFIAFSMPFVLIVLISLFLRLISKNSFVSNLILSILCLVITIISFYKAAILEVPLLVTDIFLLNNVFEIAGYGNLFFKPKIIIIITIILELLLVQFIILKKQDKNKITKKQIAIRSILLVIVFLIIARGCVVNNKTNMFYTPINQFEFKTSYISYGATFMFFKSIENLFPDVAPGYSKQKIDEIKSETEKIQEESDSISNVKPNIIAIMSESLFDITKVEKLKFSKDPLKNIKEIARKHYGGTMVSPSYAGGTSLPEFEFLTGLTTNFFNTTNVYPYSQYVNGKVNSIVRTYNNNGYKCIAMHPNGGNFYNRAMAYNFLGFDERIFIDDMEIQENNGRYVGNYVTDAELIQEIIESYETSSKEKNKFIFAVSMQNHTPYGAGNYSSYDIEIEFLEKVSQSEKDAYLAYTQGVHDADIAFRKLVDYFDNVDEPTIIVMFGDHLPGINSLKNIYYEDDNLKKHQTPYYIYTNYEIEDDKHFEENISAANLGLKILEMSNIEMPWYYRYIQSIYEEYPVITNQFIINNQNNICKNITNKRMQNYMILQYDLLHKRKYIPVN